jgi:hypothetical protein
MTSLNQSDIASALHDPITEDQAAELWDYFPYQTIKFSGRLKILDPLKQVATFTRRQRIRFLEDNVAIFFDRVWGDGVVFAGYSAPGLRILEPFKTFKGYIVPLALPRLFSKGEIFEVVTQRKIVGAFYETDGYWETAMSTPTDLVNISVITPADVVTGPAEIRSPARGDIDASQTDHALRLRVARPALNVPYRLQWAWK